MVKKIDIIDEVEEYRKENIRYEEFRGKTDALYIVEFTKPLLTLGFTTDQILTLITNKQAIDLSVDIKQAEIEIEKYRLNGGVCNCPECVKARGEEEDDGL